MSLQVTGQVLSLSISEKSLPNQASSVVNMQI